MKEIKTGTVLEPVLSNAIPIEVEAYRHQIKGNNQILSMRQYRM